MPIVIPPGFLQVHYLFRLVSGHSCQTVWAYSTSAPLDQGTVDAISAFPSSEYRAILNGGSRYDGVHILEGNDGPETVWDSASGAGAGTRSGALLPPQVQALIKKNTGVSGRRFHGRAFVADLQEGDVDDVGNLSGGAISLVSALRDALYAITGTTPTLLSVLLHNDPETAPTPVTSVVTETRVATLRRRYER